MYAVSLMLNVTSFSGQFRFVKYSDIDRSDDRSIDLCAPLVRMLYVCCVNILRCATELMLTTNNNNICQLRNCKFYDKPSKAIAVLSSLIHTYIRYSTKPTYHTYKLVYYTQVQTRALVRADSETERNGFHTHKSHLLDLKNTHGMIEAGGETLLSQHSLYFKHRHYLVHTHEDICIVDAIYIFSQQIFTASRQNTYKKKNQSKKRLLKKRKIQNKKPTKKVTFIVIN